MSRPGLRRRTTTVMSSPGKWNLCLEFSLRKINSIIFSQVSLDCCFEYEGWTQGTSQRCSFGTWADISALLWHCVWDGCSVSGWGAVRPRPTLGGPKPTHKAACSLTQPLGPTARLVMCLTTVLCIYFPWLWARGFAPGFSVRAEKGWFWVGAELVVQVQQSRGHGFLIDFLSFFFLFK